MINCDKALTYFIALVVVLIPVYLVRFNIFGIPTNILEILIAILFFSILSKIVTKRQKVSWGSVWVYLFLFSAVLGLALANFSDNALGIFKSWFLIPVIFYWTIINVVVKQDASFIISLLAKSAKLSLLLISGWAILQYFGAIGLLSYQANDQSLFQYLIDGNLRAFGPFNSPNYLAMFIVPMIFVSMIGVLDTQKGFSRIVYFSSYILPVYALFLTGSRGGMMALGAGLFILAVAYIRKRVKEKTKQVFAIFGLTAGVALLVGLVYFLSGSRGGGDNVRMEIYDYAWRLIKHNWIFGIGLGNFQTKVASFVGNDVYQQIFLLPAAYHPHNLFAAIWLNLGLFGIISFAGLVWDFFKKNIHRKIAPYFTPTCFLVAAVISILVHGLVDTTYFKNDLSVIFFLVIGLSQVNLTNFEKNNT